MEIDRKSEENAERVGGIEVRQEMETGRGIREVCVCIYREENE